MKLPWTAAALAAAILLGACGGPETEPYEEVRPVKTMVAGRQAGSVGAS